MTGYERDLLGFMTYTEEAPVLDYPGPPLAAPTIEEHGNHFDASWSTTTDGGWTVVRHSGVNFPSYQDAYACLVRNGVAIGPSE